MYIRLNDDGSVRQYPYTITDLVLTTPEVSFSRNVTDEQLVPFNVFPVVPQAYPVVDYTKNVSDSVIHSDGQWKQLWIVTEASDAEKEERIAAAWVGIRGLRDEKLAACDWTQLPDVPLTDEQKTEWQTYRAALRDVTNQPDPFNIQWPPIPA